MISLAAAKLISLLLAAGAGLMWSSIPLDNRYRDGAHYVQFALGLALFVVAWWIVP